ncbi:MAG: hypothetical protein J1G06_04005 [Oscillospiraceae bacterium]|nr:hypothetical protein [Oscillospiraceae bacterium]
MKKKYIDPEIHTSVFDNENIVTTTSDATISAAKYAEKNAATVFGTDDLKSAIVF